MYVATPLTAVKVTTKLCHFDLETPSREIERLLNKKKVSVWKSCNSAGCKEENRLRVQPCPVSSPPPRQINKRRNTLSDPRSRPLYRHNAEKKAEAEGDQRGRTQKVHV